MTQDRMLRPVWTTILIQITTDISPEVKVGKFFAGVKIYNII